MNKQDKKGIGWTDYDLGWLAGVIDGDGSLSLLKEKTVKAKSGYTYKSRLNIGNTDIELLKKAQSITGGAIIKQNSKFREDKGRKPFWNLDVSANNLRIVLPQLKLISKEKQRILLLKALKILSNHTGRGGYFRTDLQIMQLEQIYRQIRFLNGRVWNKNAKN